MTEEFPWAGIPYKSFLSVTFPHTSLETKTFSSSSKAFLENRIFISFLYTSEMFPSHRGYFHFATFVVERKFSEYRNSHGENSQNDLTGDQNKLLEHFSRLNQVIREGFFPLRFTLQVQFSHVTQVWREKMLLNEHQSRLLWRFDETPTRLSWSSSKSSSLIACLSLSNPICPLPNLIAAVLVCATSTNSKKIFSFVYLFTAQFVCETQKEPKLFAEWLRAWEKKIAAYKFLHLLIDLASLQIKESPEANWNWYFDHSFAITHQQLAQSNMQNNRDEKSGKRTLNMCLKAQKVILSHTSNCASRSPTIFSKNLFF